VVQVARSLPAAVLELQSTWAEKERPAEKPTDPRPVDAMVDATNG